MLQVCYFKDPLSMIYGNILVEIKYEIHAAVFYSV